MIAKVNSERSRPSVLLKKTVLNGDGARVVVGVKLAVVDGATDAGSVSAKS